mgnify:CR=1 FL=1
MAILRGEDKKYPYYVVLFHTCFFSSLFGFLPVLR